MPTAQLRAHAQLAPWQGVYLSAFEAASLLLSLIYFRYTSSCLELERADCDIILNSLGDVKAFVHTHTHTHSHPHTHPHLFWSDTADLPIHCRLWRQAQPLASLRG